MTTNKVKSHSTRSLLCLILFRKNIFCRGQSLDACYQRFMTKGCKYATKCQCPSRADTSFLQLWRTLPVLNTYIRVNALSGLYLISTLHRLQMRDSSSSVSMPSRAYTSFLRYPFKNLGFMRFSESVFAGIYQNILTTAVFRAC